MQETHSSPETRLRNTILSVSPTTIDKKMHTVQATVKYNTTERNFSKLEAGHMRKASRLGFLLISKNMELMLAPTPIMKNIVMNRRIIPTIFCVVTPLFKYQIIISAKKITRLKPVVHIIRLRKFMLHTQRSAFPNL